MKKNLKNISLITIDGVGNKTEQLDKVVDLSCFNFEWNSIIRISPVYENTKSISNSGVVYEIKIPKLSYYEYNNFCIKNLYDILNICGGDYCLLVQEDGFIINPDLWDDSFLDFDYIGAPWLKYSNEPKFGWVEHYGDRAMVGNGGFSLRSKKLLKECINLPYEDFMKRGFNEDVFLCAVYGEYLRKIGIKFADVDTAGKFSLETKNDKSSAIQNKNAIAIVDSLGIYSYENILNQIINYTDYLK
jgi:hypothetical protein